MNNERINNEQEKKSNVALKVIGTLLGIIAGIVLIAIIFSKTVLPVIMYNNAEKYAEAENYVEAYNILVKCGDYKDAPQKRGEYILIIGETCLESGYMDEAIEYFEIAYNSQNEKAKEKAYEYLIELKPEKYN